MGGGVGSVYEKKYIRYLKYYYITLDKPMGELGSAWGEGRGWVGGWGGWGLYMKK